MYRLDFLYIGIHLQDIKNLIILFDNFILYDVFQWKVRSVEVSYYLCLNLYT